MGTNLFDVILSLPFGIATAVAGIASVAALLLSKKRGKKLSIKRKTSLIAIAVLAVAYFLFLLVLVVLFDSAPPLPPTPQ